MLPNMTTLQPHTIRAGIAGLGMIFTETYRPLFELLSQRPLLLSNRSQVSVLFSSVATRTGSRAEQYRLIAPEPLRSFQSFSGPDSATQLTQSAVDVVCIATPDHRHFEIAKAALHAGKHVLIEKPSVLALDQLDELCSIASAKKLLAKVVYHKLADPDHKRLRTLVQQGHLKHVNNGYCSLLEPKSISMGQFSEWIHGRNPATYVAVHYIKLIDFTFGPDWALSRIAATGQRGLVDSATSATWDSVQLQITYTHPDQREATFDIHTSWVMPDNFLGYVEQEVQFRFDNAIWNAHQRKRGVEVVIEDLTPGTFKATPNHHYNGSFIEPWGESTQRGYGIEILERFFREVAELEFGGPPEERQHRYREITSFSYNDLSAERNTVGIVQALEALLQAQAEGYPGSIVKVNGPAGGLVLYRPGVAEPTVLYDNQV
jgi:D-galacturonate reductase